MAATDDQARAAGSAVSATGGAPAAVPALPAAASPSSARVIIDPAERCISRQVGGSVYFCTRPLYICTRPFYICTRPLYICARPFYISWAHFEASHLFMHARLVISMVMYKLW